MMLSRSITLISKQGKSSLLLLSPFSCVQLCATPQMTPTRLPHPWDFPGKNTGVCCHFPLQCMKVKSESEVAQSCLTLSYPMDCSPPGTSVHGILQARIVEWVAIPFSSGIFLTPGSNLGLPHCRQILYHLSHQRSPGDWATNMQRVPYSDAGSL